MDENHDKHVSEKWWVSPFNFIPEVTSSFNLPQSVSFHDVTLRDGEQTPGVVFNKQDKLEIARALSEAGVERIEAGMPVISQEEKEAIKAITRERLSSKIFTLCRLIKSDIDQSIEVDVDGVIIEAPVGVPKLKQFGWTLEQVKSATLETLDYAKSHGLYTVFFGVDTTRADVQNYFEFIQEIEKSKADSIAVVDTFGCITPEAMAYLVKHVTRFTKKPVEVHTHNDTGLATATTLAAVTQGARVVHVAVNGLGERTGNAPLEEVAVGLKLLYGMNVRIKLERLFALSELVEEKSGFLKPTNKPIVGKRAFARESGISVAGWAKYHLGSEPFLPDLFGNRHEVLVGKKSGRHSIEYKLKELGFSDFDEKSVNEILVAVKDLAQKKKRALTDQEFLEIANALLRAHA
jgi:methanogen homocitrate synthase